MEICVQVGGSINLLYEQTDREAPEEAGGTVELHEVLVVSSFSGKRGSHQLRMQTFRNFRKLLLLSSLFPK